MPRLPVFALALSCSLAACSDGPSGDDGGGPGRDAGPGDSGTPIDAGPDAGPVDTGVFTSMLPSYPQRPGDPGRGYTALVNNGYVGCGLPYSAYRAVVGPAPQNLRLSGRNAINADISYDNTAFTTSSSVTVVTANCLACHASVLNGELIMGLGDSLRDFTEDPSGLAQLAGNLITDPAERVEWMKWSSRLSATGPYIQTKTIGVNPADNLAAILFAHRDQDTLAWLPQPALAPPPRDPPAVDVPPWWRMKKKNVMFYSASGRGDHARIMMTASVLCVDSVAEAQAIDSYFTDVRAYIESLTPPPFPGTVDSGKANLGKTVFATYCARCHGSYGTPSSYPNFVIDLAEIGTDPLLAEGTGYFDPRFVDWFNGSFYGEIAHIEPVRGYVSPPLDGIWATAPFLHNGSVPDLGTLLDSSARPTYWTRTFSNTDYDLDKGGWRYTTLTSGQAGVSDLQMRKRIYDTTLPGYSNTGHTFGDALTADQRANVIEYLKTL